MALKPRVLRRRIRNIQHVRQIAKAMYTIASTQVIQRKKVLFPARPLGKEGLGILSDVAAWAQDRGIHHPLIQGNGRPGQGLMVINADRGLCGRYVDEVNQAALRFCQEHPEARLILGGEKAIRFFRHRPNPVIKTYSRSYERPTPDLAQVLLTDLLSLYEEVGEIHVVYTEFRNELVQRVRVEQLLPIPLPQAKPREFLGEPDLVTVVDELVRLYLVGRIYLILVEAKAAESAARRQAMKAATDNADELLGKLTIQYNKARQQRITLELADIMGGAEALREE